MRVLLDTHALLWWFAGDERLSARARAAIEDEGTAVYVSAASAWEVATKVRIGKLPGAASFVAELPGHLRSQGFHELAVTLAHAVRAGGLPGPHRDPFDRMLIAQSLTEQVPVVTRDPVFAAYGVGTLW